MLTWNLQGLKNEGDGRGGRHRLRQRAAVYQPIHPVRTHHPDRKLLHDNRRPLTTQLLNTYGCYMLEPRWQ